MGLEIPEEDYSLALALGGMRNGFSLGDLLAAYSVFPGGGEYQPAGFIREIVIDGFTAYKRVSRPTRVFSEETAYLVNDMMKTAVKTGTAKNSALSRSTFRQRPGPAERKRATRTPMRFPARRQTSSAYGWATPTIPSPISRAADFRPTFSSKSTNIFTGSTRRKTSLALTESKRQNWIAMNIMPHIT